MFKVRFLGRFLGLGFCLCAALVAFTAMVFAAPPDSIPSLPGTGPSTGTTTTTSRSTTTAARSTTTTSRSTTTAPGSTTTAAGASTTTTHCTGTADACSRSTTTTTAAGASTTTAPGSTTTIASDSCDTQDVDEQPFPDGKITTPDEVSCVEAASAVITEGEKCVNLGSGVLKSSTSTTDKACGTSSSSDNLIMQIIRSAILFLVAGIGVVMTGVLAVAGLQYMTARGNPQAVSAAKMKIFNVVVGFILYIMTTAIMNFLVPGGLFTK
jgi:hypothetical protein